MSQNFLFDPYREKVAPPLARRSDPTSSHAAAEAMQASGKADSQREIVVDAVYRWPGKTSKELAAMPGALERHQIARRLKEAETLGLIERRQEGRAECRWWPKDETPEWAD